MVEEQKPKNAAASQAKDSKASKNVQKGGEKKAQAQKSPVQRRRPPTSRTRPPAKKPAAERVSRTEQQKAAPVKSPETKKPEKPKTEVALEKSSAISAWAVTQAMEKEYSAEEFDEYLHMYEPTLCDIQEGEIINGKVMGVTKEDVIVDVGFKSEGIIPIAEFIEPINVKVGDEIEVYLDAIEDQDGQLVLSKQKADFVRVWGKVKESHDKGELIES
jgi:hypothetical protein